jgi:hypothetical protein
MLDARKIACPYCGESFETTVDPSGGDQEYVEDCQVCCRPVTIRLKVNGPALDLEVRRDDD